MEWEKYFLMPRLEGLSKELEKRDIRHELTLADGHCPGVRLYPDEEHAVFCTFFQDEEREITFLRLSAPDIEDRDIRWMVPVDDPLDTELFLLLVNRFLNGTSLHVFPEEGMEVSQEPGEDEEIPFVFDVSTSAGMVKLNSISYMLAQSEEIQTGVLIGAVPYLQLDADGRTVTLSYETDRDVEGLFLLHIREDVPVSDLAPGMSPVDFCHAFNERSSFVRAFAGLPAFPVFGQEDAPGEDCVCFHTVIPEQNPMNDPEYYELLLSIFENETKR